MLELIKQALDSTGLPFAHYGWAKNARELAHDYGVWAEDSEDALFADNKHAERMIEGTIDYFTRDPSGAPMATIEAALNTVPIAWYLNSIQFEDDTGYIHYEWVWQC